MNHFAVQKLTQHCKSTILRFKKLQIKNKGERSNIYPAFSIQTIPSDQVVDEMFLFIEVFHLINEEGILKLQCHHFTTFNESSDSDNGNHRLPISPKSHQACASGWRYIPHHLWDIFAKN